MRVNTSVTQLYDLPVFRGTFPCVSNNNIQHLKKSSFPSALSKDSTGHAEAEAHSTLFTIKLYNESFRRIAI